MLDISHVTQHLSIDNTGRSIGHLVQGIYLLGRSTAQTESKDPGLGHLSTGKNHVGLIFILACVIQHQNITEQTITESQRKVVSQTKSVTIARKLGILPDSAPIGNGRDLMFGRVGPLPHTPGH